MRVSSPPFQGVIIAKLTYSLLLPYVYTTLQCLLKSCAGIGTVFASSSHWMTMEPYNPTLITPCLRYQRMVVTLTDSTAYSMTIFRSNKRRVSDRFIAVMEEVCEIFLIFKRPDDCNLLRVK